MINEQNNINVVTIIVLSSPLKQNHCSRIAHHKTYIMFNIAQNKIHEIDYIVIFGYYNITKIILVKTRHFYFSYMKWHIRL